MSRQPIRSIVRAAVLAASVTCALPLGAQQSPGLRYEFRTSSEKGEPSGGTGYVLGVASRVEMSRSGGEFLVLQPGHLYSVHPDKREYSDSRPEALSDVIGTALRATQLLVRFELSDVEILAQDLGGGESIAGQATHHYRMIQRFSVSVHPLIIGKTDDPPEKNEVVTDYWVATSLRLPRNPLVELLSNAPSALAQQDRGFARRSVAMRDSLFSGMPMKVQVTARKGGEHSRVAQMFEVTSVARVNVDASLFEIPADYRRTDGISINSM